MKLKELFKKKRYTRPERPPLLEDEELVSAIRTVMGDHIADTVKNRIDLRAEYDADIAALEEELTALRADLSGQVDDLVRTGMGYWSMLCDVVSRLPVGECGAYCLNGYPGQMECPTHNVSDPEGLCRCDNVCPSLDWKVVLRDSRALLLRKRDCNRLTDEEKDELLRSADEVV